MLLLGQRLIQATLLTLEQVQVALQSQVVHGGRIGTSILKLGLLDIDTLANTLATHHDVPPARLKHFEQAERAALTMIPAALALKYHAVPLMTSPRTKELIVAFRDPTDLAAIDDISFLTGVRIRPFVAPEVCIQRYLERYYGDKAGAVPMGMPVAGPRRVGLTSKAPPDRVPPAASMAPRAPASGPPMPSRFPEAAIPLKSIPIAIGHRDALSNRSSGAPVSPSAGEAAKAQAAAPSADGVPLVPAHAFLAPDVPWKMAPKAPAATPPGTKSPEIHLGAALVVPAPQEEEPILLTAIASTPAGPPEEPPHGRPALTLDGAIAHIASAETKDSIGEAIVDYLRSSYGCGLILIVKDGIGLGWMGFAPGIDADVIGSITVPLTSTSIFQQACERRTLFRGAPVEESVGVQARFFKLLRCDPPSEVITAPIALNKRVVNLIYVHAFDRGELHESAPEELTRLTKAAADSFRKLIKATKTQKS